MPWDFTIPKLLIRQFYLEEKTVLKWNSKILLIKFSIEKFNLLPMTQKKIVLRPCILSRRRLKTKSLWTSKNSTICSEILLKPSMVFLLLTTIFKIWNNTTVFISKRSNPAKVHKRSLKLWKGTQIRHKFLYPKWHLQDSKNLK